MTYLLGKKPFVRDARDLRLASYLDKPKLLDSAQAPRLADWMAMSLPSGDRPQPDTDPLANDRRGCCVFSMGGHFQNLVCQHTLRSNLRVTAEMVEFSYLHITGGDNGAYIREDLLKVWKRDGLWGTKLLAYGRVNWRDPEEVALGNWLFGGLLGGYRLPSIFDRQVDAKGRWLWVRPEGGWRPGEGPNMNLGHAIYTHGERSGITWGSSVVMDQPWTDDSCDELWFGLLDIWELAGRAPNGFDWHQLVLDAEARAAP